MKRIEPIVTMPSNLTDRVATGLGLDPVMFQNMVCQIVEYVGDGDEIDDFIQRKIRKAEKSLDESLKETKDEIEAQLMISLDQIQKRYKLPEWLRIEQNGYIHQINTAHIRALTFRETDKHVMIIMGGEQDYLEVTAEQWAERTPLSGAEVLNPPKKKTNN